MATFGYTSIGALNSSVSDNAIRGAKFTVNEGGTITAIRAYCTSAPTETLRGYVYADSSGDPGALLATGSEINLTNSEWQTLPISYTFTAGTYWLCMFGGGAGAGQVQYDSPGQVSNQVAYHAGLTYPSAPDPFTKDAFVDAVYSIYAEYTPAVSVPLMPTQPLERPFNMSSLRR